MGPVLLPVEVFIVNTEVRSSAPALLALLCTGKEEEDKEVFEVEVVSPIPPVPAELSEGCRGNIVASTVEAPRRTHKARR